MPTYNNNSFSGETNSEEGNRHSSEGDLNVYNIECVDGYVATPNGSLKNMIIVQEESVPLVPKYQVIP